MEKIDITNKPAALLIIWKIAGKVRRRLWRILSRFLLGRSAGNVLTSSIHSIRACCCRTPMAEHLENAVLLSPAQCVDYQFPSHFPGYFRRQKAFDRWWMYLLKDIVVSPESGLGWILKGPILQESVGSLYRLLGWGRCLHYPLLPTGKLQTQNPVVVMPSTGYFHWLLENLPGVISAFNHFDNVQLLLPRNPPSYILEAADWILENHGKSKSCFICDHPVRCSRVVQPQVGAFSGFVYPDAIAGLRSEFLSSTDDDLDENLGKENLIYVSRRKTPKRIISNEAALEEAMREYGFTIVYSEELSFRKQVKLFSHASWIVGPHGAGLSNLVWAKKGIGLLEIFPNNIFNDCFARLAVSLGFKYDYIRCDLDPKNVNRVAVDQVVKNLRSMMDGNCAAHADESCC